MPGSSLGTLFRVTTAGESHGPAVVAIIDGCPPGIELSADDIRPDLARRRPGQSGIVSQRDEADEPEILSGVFEGRTTGTPICILVRNQDQKSADYSEIKEKYRPGHADYTYDAAYGLRDWRGSGRASARETVGRVAAAAVARKFLAGFGVRVVGYVKQVGDVIAQVPDPAAVTPEQVEKLPDGRPNIVRCPDPKAAERMIALIEKVRSEQDSVGGVCELVAVGVPRGLGDPVFDKLKADLAKGVMSLPAVLGFEYGAGFAVAGARGSANNDVFMPPSHPPAPATVGGGPPRLTTASNRHGGMLGGLSSGMPLLMRAAIKPTSSLPREQPTVTRTGEPTTIRTRGRHDPCLLPRFVPMGEAMVLLVLADHLLRRRAQCPEMFRQATDATGWQTGG